MLLDNLLITHHVRCGDKLYAIKPTPPSESATNLRIKTELGHNDEIRTHIDENTEKPTLIYEYYTDDVLAFIFNESPTFSQRKKIVYMIDTAIQKMHANDWVHLRTFIKILGNEEC
jgi:hypothetical protein